MDVDTSNSNRMKLECSSEEHALGTAAPFSSENTGGERRQDALHAQGEFLCFTTVCQAQSYSMLFPYVFTSIANGTTTVSQQPASSTGWGHAVVQQEEKVLNVRMNFDTIAPKTEQDDGEDELPAPDSPPSGRRQDSHDDVKRTLFPENEVVSIVKDEQQADDDDAYTPSAGTPLHPISFSPTQGAASPSSQTPTPPPDEAESKPTKKGKKSPPPPPQIIDHLAVATTEARGVFEEMKENWYQYAKLGRSREAGESMSCDCTYDPGEFFVLFFSFPLLFPPIFHFATSLFTCQRLVQMLTFHPHFSTRSPLNGLWRRRGLHQPSDPNRVSTWRLQVP